MTDQDTDWAAGFTEPLRVKPGSTVRLPDDFDPAEHKNMVCVESGNVGRNKIKLAPGKSSALKVTLGSQPV